uniref:Candidate secreted effector n=1 Tax=Meloidogyne incognita TaxID=6306 RepID=A0A914KL28_MELIC
MNFIKFLKYGNCKIKLRKEFINNTCIWIRKIPIRVPTDVFCPKSDRMGWIRI